MRLKSKSKHRKAVDKLVLLRPVRGKMPRVRDREKFADPTMISKAIMPTRIKDAKSVS